MTRKEHTKWCQDRSLEYINNGDLSGAIASFVSDMAKEPETAQIIAIFIEIGEIDKHVNTLAEFKEWMLGFQ